MGPYDLWPLHHDSSLYWECDKVAPSPQAFPFILDFWTLNRGIVPDECILWREWWIGKLYIISLYISPTSPSHLISLFRDPSFLIYFIGYAGAGFSWCDTSDTNAAQLQNLSILNPCGNLLFKLHYYCGPLTIVRDVKRIKNLRLTGMSKTVSC